MLNLNKNYKYLLACSFGPDSMALLKMLLNEKYNFEVAHVNYNLREEAKKETEDLLEYCNKHNITCHVYYVKEAIKTNVEEKCREIRYEYFKSLFDEHKFDALLVAHQQDDLIETYYLQKQRNILPRYYGLQEETVLFGMNVIRPLLNYKKSELLDFCKENQVPFAIDSTNLLDIYARNKIRHEIVEKMDDIQRKEVIEIIYEENIELAKQYEQVDKLEGLTNQQMLELDPVIFRLYLNKLAKDVSPDFEVSKKVAREIRKLLQSNKPNISFPVSKSLRFMKEYETSFFDFENEMVNFYFLLEEAGKLDTPYFYLDFTKGASNRNVKEGDYPLVIRNANYDDSYVIKNYPVKVRRLFIDWKMPMSLRKRWPVILNKDNKIIYIPRYQKNFNPDMNCNFYVKKHISLK